MNDPYRDTDKKDPNRVYYMTQFEIDNLLFYAWKDGYDTAKWGWNKANPYRD